MRKNSRPMVPCSHSIRPGGTVTSSSARRMVRRSLADEVENSQIFERSRSLAMGEHSSPAGHRTYGFVPCMGARTCSARTALPGDGCAVPPRIGAAAPDGTVLDERPYRRHPVLDDRPHSDGTRFSTSGPHRPAQVLYDGAGSQ